ncbi:T9SS type A sorting domain-containing protein [Ferruginibacter sp. SUN106]|uniref:Ig-like domain-containing protein n=1 Tax=Ferruginibacter sp. SUN106 TaxID=2978348 RepID=UPI003D36484E
MKRILFFLICMICLAQTALAQPATYGIPVGLGRNNCGSGGGTDSMYFFNYAAAGLTRASYPNAYRPRLKVGPASTTDRWSIFQASISFNPKDQKLYYLWTDYSHNIRPTGTWTYIWRFKPDTTFATAASPGTANFIDTLRSFPYDIGGVAFDNNGIGWTLEFPLTNPCARAFFRPIDFAANIYNAADTLDFTSGAGGIGDTLWNPGSGDITMLPSGQIYYNFDNKLYTPDYGSYGGPTHHIKSTYIDTTRRPAGTTALVGLAFADGDLISSYATGCIYRRLDPVTGDTNYVNYTYAANKGVYSVDMTQINSGIGASKKLVSVTATGTANQYDVVYDVYVRNYGTVPVTNVQVSDNLGLINGIGNVSNVTAAFTSNPAGLSLNPLYNGTVVTNLLLGTQTLPNYPTANNNFTIRISCRLSNIQAGVVYNNQAVATAGGFNNTALRDSSTNGNNPDLNQNDKPDDVGESQPTPFVIILTPVTAPCAVLGNVLYTQDFGSGVGLKNAIPTSPNTASTTYIGSTTAPLSINRFSITNNAVNGDASNWISLTDHTGGANGNMMVVNADASASIFYRDTLPVACPGQQYSVTLWAAFIGNTSYQTTCNGLGGFKYPKFLIKIRDLATGLVITQTTTADITSTSWTQYGMKFGLPAGYSNLILEIVNAGPGGCGNDVAIDDIQFGSCSAAPTANVSGAGGCLGTSTTFNSTLSDPTAISGTPVYQWQVATALAGPYTDIVGATSANYTIPSLAASDTGKYYRVIVASSGNIGIAGCQYISPGIKLNGLVPSTAPASVSATASTICNSGSTTLTAVGATLGTGANYQWGTGSVVGTNPIVGATSSTLTVSPSSTTTYWVQVQNTTSPCSATTGGVTKVVTVNQPSVAPSSISGADFCNPGSTTLTVGGGALGTGANYQWGTGSVVGTSPIVGATGSTLTISPTSTTTYWVRIENGTAPCALTTGGVTKIVTVMQPSVAPASVSATASTICNSGSTTLTAVGATLGTGANYQWGTGSVIGTNPIVGATSSTLTVSPSSTTTYWVQVENTTSPCAATTGGVTKVVTVNQPSVAPSSISGADFCNPGSTTLTAGGGSLGTGANYQWGTGSVIGTNPIVGATSSTLTISPTSTTTYWVRIENGTAPCSLTTGGVTKVVTVTQPSVAPASVSATASTLCGSGSTTLTAVGATLGTGANYQWGTGSVVGTNPIVGATGSTLTVSPSSTTTYWVQVENTSSPCTAVTGGVTKVITVNQASVAPSSVTGADFCNPGSTILTAGGGSLGTGANYQWGTGSVVGTSPIVGATSSTLTVSPTSSTTYWVRIENGTAPCALTTSGITKLITVTQPSVAPASVSATASTLCGPGSATLTAVGATLGTGANYQWGTGSVVGTNPIVGATGSTLTVSPSSTTTYWVQVQNTTSPCTATTGGVTKVITVNQASVAPSSVTGADFCNPGSTILTAGGGTLGTGANYQWGTGSVVGTSPIVGATSSTLTVSPTSSTTYWVRIENGTAPCALTTSGITKLITVTQPSVAPASVSATASTLCGSGSATLTAVGATLGTGANYQWGTGSVVGTNPIVGATSSTLTVSPSSTTTYWVQVQNTTSPCTATTGGVTKVITVNQASVAPSSVTGLDFCNPGSTTLTAGGGTLGTGANYQWGTGSVIGTSPIVGATSSTLTVSPTTTTTYWVRIENGTAPCALTTGGVTKLVTVSQPSVAAVTATKNKNNICPGISVSLGITGGTLGTGASWKWYTGSPGGTLVGTGSTLSVTPLVTTTYYVRAEGNCNTTTDQSVTVFISCDIDKDKDGIPDFVESGMAAAFADANSNGVINAYDPTYAGFVDNNNDFINDNFQADGDSDNDGIPNYLDTTFPGRVDSNGDGVDDRFDADKDGIINMLDLDSDNDGIPDVVEAYGVDTNGDGKIDGFSDTDGDGLSQNVDGNNTGAYNTGLGLGNIDLDGDGVPNFIDLDSDNDGIPDVVESGGADTNNDGKIDGFVDANGDGLHDGYINASGLLKTGADTNGDGKADSYPNKNLDQDLRPNAYDIDSDGDGIVDVIEAGLPDANLDGKVDGVIGTDGWSGTVSAMAALNLRNTDASGNPDYLDIDADNDGIPDNIEGQSTAGYKTPVTTDTDGDGLVNTYDNVSGFGGSGIFVWDQDGDGIPDYRDLDTDGDGQPDIAEGNDFNLNGKADDLITLTGLDTDGDGLDNRFDSLNSVTNLKGTSYMMGNSGSLIGDPAPGSRCTVQKKTPGQIDRDWRFVGSVLPVQFLGFTGSTQNTQVLLSWTILTTKEVDHFEIERSLDNTTYIKVGTVSDAVKLNEPQSFGSTDDIAGINSDIIYYRLKVVGKSGEIKYSNVLVVRKSLVKTPVAIMPNPANDYVSVKFFAEKESEVTIRLVDNLGKTVLIQKQRVSKGNNVLQLNNLAKYSAGVYTVQVFVNDEIVTHKLILER